MPKTVSHNQVKADNNTAKRIVAHRELDKLLAVAGESQFAGTIAVEISSHAGRYGKVVAKLVSYSAD